MPKSCHVVPRWYLPFVEESHFADKLLETLASPAGLEPATHSLGNCCSILLSYGDSASFQYLSVNTLIWMAHELPISYQQAPKPRLLYHAAGSVATPRAGSNSLPPGQTLVRAPPHHPTRSPSSPPPSTSRGPALGSHFRGAPAWAPGRGFPTREVGSHSRARVPGMQKSPARQELNQNSPPAAAVI
jgi:hypothetical protein